MIIPNGWFQSQSIVTTENVVAKHNPGKNARKTLYS